MELAKSRAANICLCPSPASPLKSPEQMGSLARIIFSLAGNPDHGGVPEIKYCCICRKQRQLYLWGDGATQHPEGRRPTVAIQKMYKETNLNIHQKKPAVGTSTFQSSEHWSLLKFGPLNAIFILPTNNVFSWLSCILFHRSAIFFLISKYHWKRYQNSYRNILYTPKDQVSK